MLLALFDFLVAAMAIFAALKARRGGLADVFSQGGYAAIAVAALIGTVKYAAVPALAPYHAIASQLATVVGVPFAAVGFFLITRQLAQWAMAILAVAVLGAAVAFWTSATYGLYAGIAAQVIWLWGGFNARSVAGRVLLRVLISVILTSAAGLLFAPPGMWHGIEREIIFHGLLALALMQQAYAYARTREGLAVS